MTFRAGPGDGVVWITGASAGIGRALALRLAGQGYRVAVTARRAEALVALAEASAGRILAFPGDVADRTAIGRIVAAIEATHGPIALALLNAGLYDPRERRGFDAEVAWRTIETNLGGTIFALDPLLAAMSARGRGQIALVGSLAGYRGIPGSTAYGASKAAIIYLAEALRLTYAARGLTIQVINPGFVRTAMTEVNDYDMPFILEVEAAAARICRGLAHGGFEITFPWRLAALVKATSLLPAALFFPLMDWATRRTRA